MRKNLRRTALALPLLLAACGGQAPPVPPTGDPPQATESALVTADATTSGLLGQYFDNSDFTAPRFSRVDRTVDFDWVADTPDGRIAPDTFSVRWTGTLTPPVSGTYTLAVTSDDGFVLKVNGTDVANYQGSQRATRHAGTVTLEQGKPVPVVLEYYENTGWASVILEWRRPGDTGFTVIPSAALRTPNIGPWQDPNPTPPTTAITSDTLLTNLNWAAATNGAGPVQKNKNVFGQPMRLDGVTASNGLGVHANSTLRYRLRRTCAWLNTRVGLDDSATGSAIFRVFGDGRELFDSGRVTRDDPARDVWVDVAGIDTLELRVNDAGDGDAGDVANWADARLQCAPPRGRQLWVSESGNASNSGLTPDSPLRTLQAAANITQPGDTVFVLGGTYRRDATENDLQNDVLRITRSGQEGRVITYRNAPGTKPKIVSRNWSGIRVNANYITVQGFEIQGNATNVTLRQAQDDKFRNTPWIDGNGITVGPLPEDRENQAEWNHHVVIRRNTIYEHGGSCISTGFTDHVTIEENRIRNCARWSQYGMSGISVWGSVPLDSFTGAKMIVRRNIVSDVNNFVECNCSDFKEITDGNGIIIDQNRRLEKKTGAHNYPAKPAYNGRILVENNLLYNNGARGVQIFQSDNVDVVNNTMYRNMQNAVSTGGELMLNQASNVRVVNNILVPRGDRPASAHWQASNFTYQRNLTFGGTGFAGPASGNLIGVNPQFENAAEGNFRLRADSQAIDAGLDKKSTSLAPDEDLYLLARPQGAAIDLGAIERFVGRTP